MIVLSDVIESVLCISIIDWFGSDIRWAIRTAERIIGLHLPNFPTCLVVIVCLCMILDNPLNKYCIWILNLRVSEQFVSHGGSDWI